jgi:hypothetical protein
LVLIENGRTRSSHVDLKRPEGGLDQKNAYEDMSGHTSVRRCMLPW